MKVDFKSKIFSELTRNIDWHNADGVIDFCKNNAEVLSKFENLDDDEIIDLLNIKCFNSSSLISKGRYSRARDLISDIDILNQKIKHKVDFFNAFEEIKQFNQGIISGRLKNYGESAQIFKTLIKIDPENDDYKDWYVDMRERSLSKQVSFLAFIGGAILAGDIVAETLFNYDFNNYLFLIGILLVFNYLVFPYLYKQWIKSNI